MLHDLTRVHFLEGTKVSMTCPASGDAQVTFHYAQSYSYVRPIVTQVNDASRWQYIILAVTNDSLNYCIVHGHNLLNQQVTFQIQIIVLGYL
jgi:hypothetical protein